MADRIASAFSPVIFSGFSSRLAFAAAAFSRAKARMISSGMVSCPCPMGKFCRLRSVCAPQYRSSGTGTSPMESCSILIFMRFSSCFSMISVRNIRVKRP